MKKERKIEYVCNTVRWFDRVNGNTCHSNMITRCKDGAVIRTEWTYGYGDHYRTTALETMRAAGWVDKSWNEMENNYPIYWEAHDGLKREMIKNGGE